jgi:hypothetical protein
MTFTAIEDETDKIFAYRGKLSSLLLQAKFSKNEWEIVKLSI